MPPQRLLPHGKCGQKSSEYPAPVFQLLPHSYTELHIPFLHKVLPSFSMMQTHLDRHCKIHRKRLHCPHVPVFPVLLPLPLPLLPSHSLQSEQKFPAVYTGLHNWNLCMRPWRSLHPSHLHHPAALLQNQYG